MRTLQIACVALLLLVAYTSSAHAAIEVADLFTPGDGLLTRDTTTGLEWLDIPVTLGMSYDQAETSEYVADLDFRHATITEVVTLLMHFGIIDFSASFQVENYHGARDFIDTMGPGRDTGNFDALEGFTDRDPFDPHIAVIATVDASHDGVNGRVGSGNLALKNLPAELTGNFLARPFQSAAVPELSSIAIWGFLTSILYTCRSIRPIRT